MDVVVSIEDPCGCCDEGGPCASGKKCFQTWTAIWNCDILDWIGPTAGAKVCLPVGTSTAWVKTGNTATTCTYRKYVAITPKHCCTVNGDCTGEADTAPPALPPNHDDCTCPEVVACSGCEFGADQRTPRTWTVSFSGVGNASYFCSGECTFGGQQGGSGELGTYLLTQVPGDPCTWFYEGPGPSVLISETVDEEGNCVDPVEYSTIRIELTRISLKVVHTGIPGVFDQMFGVVNNDVGDGPACCDVKHFTNNRTYGCGESANGGTATATPHC